MTKEQRKTSYCMYLVRRKNYSTMVISADTVTLWSKCTIWNSGHLILFVCAFNLFCLAAQITCYLCDKCCRVSCLQNIMQHIEEHATTDEWIFLISLRATVCRYKQGST